MEVPMTDEERFEADREAIPAEHEVVRMKRLIGDKPTLENVKPLVDHLVYSCYSYNRRLHPGISPLVWEEIFGPNTAAMEVRFWLEEFASKCISDGVFAALRETH
jgi:hypothetical protein